MNKHNSMSENHIIIENAYQLPSSFYQNICELASTLI